MRKGLLATVALATVLLAAACGSGDDSSTAAAPASAASTPSSVASTTAASASSGGADDYGYGGAYGATPTTAAASATTAAASAQGTGTVMLSETSLGNVLVDSQGMTLYLYTKDTPGQPSVCEGPCAAAWPALQDDNPTAGPGVDQSMLSTIARPDGSKQVAYNGWPLYYYAKDAKAGDVSGQGVNSVWYVVDASGNAVGK